MALMDDVRAADGAGKMASQNDMGMATVGSPQAFRIKCVGRRPMTFQGTELAMAMSFTPELPYWYEINLYRTTGQKFVVAIKLFHQSENRKDTAYCWELDSLDEVMAAIEGYSPADDVVLPKIPDGMEMSAAECAALACDLRARVADMTRHYQGLAGEFMHELDADD